MGIISPARFAHNAVGLISRPRYRVPKTVLASVGLPRALSRLSSSPAGHTLASGLWPFTRSTLDGLLRSLAGTRPVEEPAGARAPGPRPPCELAGLGVGERERADGEVVNGHDASLAHPVSPLQFRAPASIQWAVAVALAAVQDRTQEADAPFPAVNPCGGACLTLAPSPPPISPSLPRPPSGRRLSPARRVPSRILYSRKDLEERLYNHLLISCAEKKTNAPIRSDSSPRPTNPDTVPSLADENSQRRPLTPRRRFQFSVSRSQACGPCSLPFPPPGLLALPLPCRPSIHPHPSHPPSLPHLPLACATLVTCSAHHRLTRHSIPGQRSPHLIKHAPSLEHRVHSLNWHRPSPRQAHRSTTKPRHRRTRRPRHILRPTPTPPTPTSTSTEQQRSTLADRRLDWNSHKSRSPLETPCCTTNTALDGQASAFRGR